MRLLWIRDIVTTSGHSSRAMVDLPADVKNKVAYVII